MRRRKMEMEKKAPQMHCRCIVGKKRMKKKREINIESTKSELSGDSVRQSSTQTKANILGTVHDNTGATKRRF